jgi:hypothetical protein
MEIIGRFLVFKIKIYFMSFLLKQDLMIFMTMNNTGQFCGFA